jgi:hypothetical protein
MKVTLTEESKQTLAQHPEFTEKWIAGLRSGKYTQVQNRMYDPKITNSACCLMVMEMVCNEREWGDHRDDVITAMPSDMEKPYIFPDGLLPQLLWARTDDGEGYSVDGWNDALSMTFEQIADLLEYGEVEIHD